MTPRWSLFGFFDAGWVARDERSQFVFKEGNLAAGTGFCDLMPRTFGTRSGMDFAWSEDDFAFYITTGTAWGQKQ